MGRMLLFPIEKNVGSHQLIIDLARTEEQIDQVFRLRYKIFNEELNEGLATSKNTGRDQDKYDEFCEHLLIIDAETKKIVGTYRLHRWDQAKKGYGYYASNEFDLGQLIAGGYRLLEIGRACVDIDYRNGTVMNALWVGLLTYMKMHDLEYMVGCASLEKNADAEQASLVYAYAKAKNHLTSNALRVKPNQANCVAGFSADMVIKDMMQAKRSLPSLLRGYFSIDCKICGEPAYDPEFGVIDFFVLCDFTQAHNSPLRRLMD